MNSILKNEEMRVESEKTRVYVQKPRLKIPFKNSISEGTLCPESGLANEDEWSPCCQICVPMVRIKAREGMVSTMQPFRMLINSYFYGSPLLMYTAVYSHPKMSQSVISL